MRQSPDKDWEPAIREGIKPPGENAEEMYQQVLEKLKEREITTEDYELMLNLEGK